MDVMSDSSVASWCFLFFLLRTCRFAEGDGQGAGAPVTGEAAEPDLRKTELPESWAHRAGLSTVTDEAGATDETGTDSWESMKSSSCGDSCGGRWCHRPVRCERRGYAANGYSK